MGTSQAWVARLEGGRLNPGLKSVERYLDAIGLELELEAHVASIREFHWRQGYEQRMAASLRLLP